jgi:hypothetical protein
MSWTLIEKLEVARQLLGRAITIGSGVRCVEHNKNVGGSTTSSHLVEPRNGEFVAIAVDLHIGSANDAFELTKILMAVGFRRIGIRSKGDRRFIHADLDDKKVQDVIWTYNEPTPA